MLCAVGSLAVGDCGDTNFDDDGNWTAVGRHGLGSGRYSAKLGIRWCVVL